MEELLSHLGQGTKDLREAIKKKEYDNALDMVKDIKIKRALSETQEGALDNLEKEIIKLKSNI